MLVLAEVQVLVVVALVVEEVEVAMREECMAVDQD
jgi:hypothetical protein